MTEININTNLNNYLLKDLKILCKEHNIIGYSNKKKDDLIKLLNEKLKNNIVEVIEPIDYNEEIVQNIIFTKNQELKFIDLFCGIGGFHQVLHKYNSKCVFACDIDENCRKMYEKNYGIKPEGDITKINIQNIPQFDILCGGFPCQSFSNSGKKKGFKDDRGNLFENILSIATVKKPLFMFLENVKHIKKIDNGNVFKHIIKRINECGYIVNDDTVFELSPHQLGIPQQRERVIFVCIRKDLYDIEKKIIINPPIIPINLENIIEKDTKITDKYRISNETEEILNVWDEIIKEFDENENLSPTILCNEFYKTYSEQEFKALPSWKQEYIEKNKPIYKKYKDKWDKWYDNNKSIILKKEIFGKLEWQVGKKKQNDTIFNHFIQFRQSGIRVKKGSYFPTLVAIVQTPIYAKEKRYITPRECARLQSFPDSFIMHDNDHTAYKQFGNAVNVDVINYVIKNTFTSYGLI